jgi:PadR family transcriptional regulator PadR
MVNTDAFNKLELELRRGVVVLATLSQLRAPRYGYELRQALSDKGMPIEEGTLYPLLRRLETGGWLAATLLLAQCRWPQIAEEADRVVAGHE